MLPCVHYLLLLKGFQVLDSVVHRLYLVRNDKLHPWKKSMAYCFGGNSTVSDIISALVLGMYAL